MTLVDEIYENFDDENKWMDFSKAVYYLAFNGNITPKAMQIQNNLDAISTAKKNLVFAIIIKHISLYGQPTEDTASSIPYENVVLSDLDAPCLNIFENSMNRYYGSFDKQNVYSNLKISKLDFFKEFSQDTDTPTKEYTLSFEDSAMYISDGLLKIKLKQFNESKTKHIIQYILEHPNQMIERKDLIQYNFDQVDRLSDFIHNLYPNDHILVDLFFQDISVDSVLFKNNITDIDVKRLLNSKKD